MLYQTLPSVPTVNALPQGVPQGPWHQLYRGAPGSMIPAAPLPIMLGQSRYPGGIRFQGPVKFQGLGQDETGVDVAKKAVMLTAGAAVSAGVAYGAFYYAGAARPKNAALFMGVISLLAGAYRWATAGTPA